MESTHQNTKTTSENRSFLGETAFLVVFLNTLISHLGGKSFPHNTEKKFFNFQKHFIFFSPNHFNLLVEMVTLKTFNIAFHNDPLYLPLFARDYQKA